MSRISPCLVYPLRDGTYLVVHRASGRRARVAGVVPGQSEDLEELALRLTDNITALRGMGARLEAESNRNPPKETA